jgi:pyrroloquinoline quinone biosynthesis protein D
MRLPDPPITGLDHGTRPALARGVRLQTDATTGEPLLLFPEGVLYLSATAHDIAARCDGQRTIAAIICSLAAEYEGDAVALGRDVIDCLDELRQRKLLVFSQ